MYCFFFFFPIIINLPQENFGIRVDKVGVLSLSLFCMTRNLPINKSWLFCFCCWHFSWFHKFLLNIVFFCQLLIWTNKISTFEAEASAIRWTLELAIQENYLKVIVESNPKFVWTILMASLKIGIEKFVWTIFENWNWKICVDNLDGKLENWNWKIIRLFGFCVAFRFLFL